MVTSFLPLLLECCAEIILNVCGVRWGEGVLSRYRPFIREALLLQVKCKIQILYRNCDNSKFIVLYQYPSLYLGQQCFRTVTEVSNKLLDFVLQSVFLIFRPFYLEERVGGLWQTGRLLEWGVYLKLYTIPGAFNGREAFIRERAFIRSFTVYEENVF